MRIERWKRVTAAVVLSVVLGGCGGPEPMEAADPEALETRTEKTEATEREETVGATQKADPLERGQEAGGEEQDYASALEAGQAPELESEEQEGSGLEAESDGTAAGVLAEGTGLSFAELKNLEFTFSSGAGAWGTSLTIGPDGSFSGEYRDSNMGETGEKYPGGTVYLASFTGQLSEPQPAGELVYWTEIENLQYEQEVGTEEIRDGVLYRYTDAYGLDGTDRLLIYQPGAALAELSEELRSWIGYYDLEAAQETELPFYVLENKENQYGFVGYDVIAGVQELIRQTEEQAAFLEAELDAALTQTDMNLNVRDQYLLWDSALNQLWSVLKQTKDKAEMERLTAEEREWIAWKEEKIEAAGAEFEGGTMAPMTRGLEGARLTRGRVYELLEELEL